MAGSFSSSNSSFGSETDRPEVNGRAETQDFRNVVRMVEKILRSSLEPETRELFIRTAAVNAVKRAKTEIISSSALFVAAVLWGRDESSMPPAAAVQLAEAVAESDFDQIFLRDMLLENYADQGSSPEGRQIGSPEFSTTLHKMLEDLGDWHRAGGDLSVEAILTQLMRSPSLEFSTRLEESGLSSHALFTRLTGFDPGATSRTRLADDRPQERLDKLGRGALAFAMAHLVCRIWEDQQPKADEGRVNAAFIMHIDAPWGGGKTTFANFVRSILTEADDESKRAALAEALGARVATESWPAVHVPGRIGCPPHGAARLLRIASDRAPWLAATFNAWQNEHVLPSWWNFYLSVRSQLLSRLKPHHRAIEWFKETMWRVASRDTIIRICSFVVFVLALWASWRAVPMIFTNRDADSTPQSIYALLLAALAGGSGIQLVLSLRTGTEWIIRAAGHGGDPKVLGAGDPLLQFKEHFHRFCDKLNRPILIVIDDLDRCQPAYVVDMMRGLMTVFNSPRIVYLILGDRAWIETCYARAYEAMISDTQDSRAFGGHFAEKSLQLSFLLPRTPKERIDSYVDTLLAAAEVGRDAESVELIVEATKAIAKNQSGAERVVQVQSAMNKINAINNNRMRAAATQLVRDAAVIGTALSEKAGDEIRHHLQDLHDLMPNNPRQIKRVINMVALYQASALTVLGYDVGSDGWRRMALWVLLAGGYPAVWRALNADPSLADRVRERADDDQVRQILSCGLAKLFVGELPGKFEGIRLDLEGIRELQRLMPRQEPVFETARR